MQPPLRHLRASRVGLAFAALIVVTSARAEDAPDDTAGHLEEASRAWAPLGFGALLVADHPLDAAAKAALGRHGQLARGLGPLDADPTVSLMPGVRFNGIQAPGPEWAVAVSQELAVGDQLAARRAGLEAERRQLAVEVEAGTLERRLGAAHRWLDTWLLRATLARLAEEVSLVTTLLEAGRRAREAGVRTEADLAQLEAWRADLAIRTLEAEGALHDAALSLAQGLGREGPRSEAASLPVADGDLPEPPRPSSAALAAAVDALPALRVAELGARLEEARLRELEASRDLRLTLTLQADSDAEANIAARVGVAMPLRLFDRVDRDAPRQAADVELGRAALAEARRLLGHRAAQLSHDLHHTEHVLAELRSTALPAVERLAGAQERRLAAGEATIFEVLDARRRRLELLTRLEEARVAHARARVEAWLLWQGGAAQGGGGQP